MFQTVTTTLKGMSLATAIAFMIIPAQFVIVTDAEARFRSSSSSFSRSTFRSTPSKAPTFKSARVKSTPKATQRATAPKRPAVKPTRASFVQNPVQARQQQARFKQQPPKVTPRQRQQQLTTTSTRYSDNAVYSRARSFDSRTYYERRGRYYSSWDTPTYVYAGAPSYGLFDTLFLYHIMTTPHAGSMAYHYQNNADYRAWRAEADRQAIENAELRTQLAAMDAQMAKVSGPINDGFIPQGVDADLMLADTARTSLIPEFRACVAGTTGTYANVMVNTVKPNTNSVRVTIVPTSGSREILQKVSAGECDGGLVQGDSYWNYIEANETTNLPFERALTAYQESVHLMCNAGAWDTDGLAELTSATTVFFPTGSGAEETWTNLVNEDPDIAATGARTSSYEEAIAKASADRNACALYVGATGSSELLRKVEAGARSSGLELVEVVDSAVLATTDPSGAKVYTTGSLDDSTYPNLLRSGGCYGACGGDVPTLRVNADFIIGTSWKADNSTSYNGLLLDLNAMSGQLKGANK